MLTRPADGGIIAHFVCLIGRLNFYKAQIPLRSASGIIRFGLPCGSHRLIRMVSVTVYLTVVQSITDWFRQLFT